MDKKSSPEAKKPQKDGTQGHEKKKSVFRDFIFYGTSSYFSQILGVVNSIALRRFLDPESMGIVVILRVILSYCGYAGLGTAKAAFREIPYFKGKGDLREADDIKNLVFVFSLIMSLIPSIGIGIYAYLKYSDLSPYMVWGLGTLVMTIALKRFYDYYLTLLRANSEFILLSKVTVISVILDVAMTFTLVYKFKLYGFYAGMVISLVANSLIVYLSSRYSFSLIWDNKKMAALIRLGLSLFLIGFANEIVRSIDKIMIGKYLGLRELGFYSIATMAQMYLLNFPTVLSMVIYPRLQASFGERQSAEGIRNYLLMPIEVLSVFMPILLGITYFLVPWVVTWLLPQYVNGIDALQVLLFSSFFAACSHQGRSYLIALKKQNEVIPLLAVGIFAGVVLNYGALRLGMGITGIATATLLTYVLICTVIVTYGLKQFSGMKEIFLFWIKTLAPLTLLGAAMATLQILQPDVQSLPTVLLKTGIFIIICLPVLYVSNKKNGLISMAWDMVLTKIAPTKVKRKQ